MERKLVGMKLDCTARRGEIRGKIVIDTFAVKNIGHACFRKKYTPFDRACAYSNPLW